MHEYLAIYHIVAVAHPLFMGLGIYYFVDVIFKGYGEDTKRAFIFPIASMATILAITNIWLLYLLSLLMFAALSIIIYRREHIEGKKEELDDEQLIEEVQ